VPVFIFCEHHAGEESAERRRQTNGFHEQCDADDEQERRRREDLAQPRLRDKAKDMAQNKAPHKNNAADCGETGEPLRQSGNSTSGLAPGAPPGTTASSGSNARIGMTAMS